MKQTLKKSDRLFFLIGIDAFNEIATWHEAEALFRECEFIVASRPGYSLADVANALPERLRPKSAVTKPFAKQPAKGDLVLAGATVHLLENVHQNVSATAIREAVAAKKSADEIRGFGGRGVHQEDGVVSEAVSSYVSAFGLRHCRPQIGIRLTRPRGVEGPVFDRMTCTSWLVS